MVRCQRCICGANLLDSQAFENKAKTLLPPWLYTTADGGFRPPAIAQRPHRSGGTALLSAGL
jgi:hypothetical protein